jgi:hypothetical protein
MALSDNISKINIEQLDGLSSQVDTIKNLPVNFDKSLFADFAISQVKKLVNVEDLIRKLIERILKDLDICELMNSLPLDKVQSILKTLIKLRDEAINLLVKVLRVITSILSITTIISTLVTVFTTIVELIPIISAAIPMSFPPGIGLPAGIPVIFSKIYEMMLKFIKALGFILNLINDTLKTIAEKLSKFIDILKSITLDLFQCAEKLAIAQTAQTDPRASAYSPQTISVAPQDLQQKITDNFNDLIGELTPIPEINLGIQPESYKGFTFDIKVKKTVEGTPQNYAIALDVRGIQVLESLPSFASDTNVLIQELKLIIDRNNLSGF